MTIRKNFIFEKEIAKEIEEIAADEGITQTEAVKIAIHALYQEKQQAKRLEAFHNFVGSAPEGSLKDIDVKKLRTQRALDA